MRIFITFTALFIGVLFASGQNRNSLLQRINEIKSQSEIYFWDQYTCPDADTAKINATKRLLLDINRNRNDNEYLNVADVMPHVSFINIDRGKLKQFFVYIKKTDAVYINNGVNPNYNSNDNSYFSESPTVSYSTQKTFVPDAFVQRIMETKVFANVYKLLKSLQSQGQVLQFGKLRDVEDYSSFDLILFDMQSQEIVTMLSPVTPSGNRTNMVNGTEDSLDNYPTSMTAVIWYIKK